MTDAHIPSAFEVETSTGRYVDLLAPRPSQIALEDIAQGLSQTCRFGGQSSRFYSVAEHAVLVCDKLIEAECPPQVAMAGLHHDDAEAYLGDLPRPLKGALRETGDAGGWVAAEKRLDEAIWQACASEREPEQPLLWRLPDLHSEPLKMADWWALLVEAQALLPSRGEAWQRPDLPWEIERPRTMWDAGGVAKAPWERRLVVATWWGGMDPLAAKRLWFRRHEQLGSIILSP